MCFVLSKKNKIIIIESMEKMVSSNEKWEENQTYKTNKPKYPATINIDGNPILHDDCKLVVAWSTLRIWEMLTTFSFEYSF